MAPKQKMGSITHNSTEVNKPKKSGLFSKLKGSMTEGSKPKPRSQQQLGMSKSFTVQPQQQQLIGMGQNRSFTSGRDDLRLGEGFLNDCYSTFDDGIPKAILAVPPDMPADEVSEAGMTNPTMAPPQMYPVKRSQMRSQRTDLNSAQRALDNLTVGRRPSTSSAYSGSRRGSVESQSYDYMQSGFSVSSQQPPPPERAYYRNTWSGGDGYPSSPSGPSSHRRATVTGSPDHLQRNNSFRSQMPMRHSIGPASDPGHGYIINDGRGSEHSTSSLRSKSSAPSMPSFKEEVIEENSPLVRYGNDEHRSSTQYSQYDDDDMTMTTMSTKANAFRPSSMNKAKDMSAPYGDVTIVYTDVQGSTSLWESCPSAMKEAQDIHDTIMRQCYSDHKGYEIMTEGDSFNLAFQHPVDALAFALQCQQKLYQADWPKGILDHPDGKDEPNLKFRGFRVRFGIHHGPTTSMIHENTGRTVYAGEAVQIAKAIEGMCHGGQILTSMETWKAVSGMAERYLGRPQVLDCGEHLLFESKVPNFDNSG